MKDFDLRKYLTENKLLKEDITQFEEYIDGNFNASVDQEAEEGFQTGVWTKEEVGNPELYDETEKFDALVDYLANIGGKATLEGNPDITVELLGNGDIKWSADVTLTENKLLKEAEYTEFIDDGENQYIDLDYNKIRAYISNKKGPDFADDFIDGYNDDFYENVVRFLDKIENPTDEEVLNFVDIEIEKR
jgi:hypothetical protein